MCLTGVLVPHRLPHPAPAAAGWDSRRKWIERGGHGSGRHDALPQVGGGLWPGTSLKKRRRRKGRAAHRQGSIPRYRADQGPLPQGSTQVEAPSTPRGRVDPHTRQNRRPLPASKDHPPHAKRGTTPSAPTVHWTQSIAIQTTPCQVMLRCMNVA